MNLKTLEVALRSIEIQPVIKIAEDGEVVIYTGMVLNEDKQLILMGYKTERFVKEPK